ncbi:ethanolamine ammonia-lyase [Nocardia sp. ET3-3]|uniref:Ethanolamine ammonia-lyase small subunit n=1 Tax=Nocardia terrae TaxID=2675851 RepID=A0A7K1USQ2_9NOCA|nr:ethanolamine ammonia-lyase subunit EutC [Nocardia terrae]MVU77377.1 ethanolamine ammonia-lyase [Nocardia terrae]
MSFGGASGPVVGAEDGAVQAFWEGLRRSTQARIGLGRAGDGLPTAEVLAFRAAHAAARDAVHSPLDVAGLADTVTGLGLGSPVHVRSLAADRSEYLRRPDLGRLPGSVEAAGPVRDDVVNSVGGRTIWSGDGSGGNARVESVLAAVPHSGADVGFVLADGLSPRALADHGVPMLSALIEAFGERYTLAPPVIATQARVALGDHIGAALGVTTVLVLIGERPGLSVADSLGIYLTHRPRPGRSDSERNCVSNIHPPEGLSYARAAQVAVGLVDGARRLGRSGVELKDTSSDWALATPLVLDRADFS